MVQFMLDAIGAGLSSRIGDRDWKDIWLDSPEYAKMRATIDQAKQEALAKPVAENDKPATCMAVISVKKRYADYSVIS